MPFSEQAIDKSVVRLLKENVELPDFEDGYQTWRKAFAANHAGIYAISVAEAVTVVETGLRLDKHSSKAFKRFPHDRAIPCDGIVNTLRSLRRV